MEYPNYHIIKETKQGKCRECGQIAMLRRLRPEPEYNRVEGYLRIWSTRCDDCREKRFKECHCLELMTSEELKQRGHFDGCPERK